MQGAIVGFGTIGMAHLAAYRKMPDMKITAIVDTVSERCAQAQARLSDVRTYATIEALMKSEALDFIDICSPPHTHEHYIRMAITENHHVLCEKPVLLSTQDFRGLQSLLCATNRVLYPCHNYKFAPILQVMKDKVQSDGFGRLLSGHFRTMRRGHAVGVPEWNPHWRRHPAYSGGGILRDHGTHSIYMACQICGQLPTSVSCLAGNLRNDSWHDSEDTALLTLQFEDDVRLVIDLSWAANFRNSYYAIFGTLEAIIAENDMLRIATHDGRLIQQSLVSEFDDPSHQAWFVCMFQDFMDLVTNPGRQTALLQEALLTSLVIDQAYESAKRGGEWMPIPYPSEAYL